MLAAVDAGGLAGNTLVIFTSDHGEARGSHGLVVKLTPYEEALRVPLVLRCPGVLPVGRTADDQPASGLDVAPTILDFAGAKPSPQMAEVSLRRVVDGTRGPVRDFVVSELYPDLAQPDRQARIVCTPESKCIFAIRDRQECEQALHDLRQDPGERHNLAGRPESRRTLDEMQAHLRTWMRSTDDGPPASGGNCLGWLLTAFLVLVRSCDTKLAVLPGRFQPEGGEEVFPSRKGSWLPASS